MYYGQNKEDKFIHEWFGRTDLKYIDCGANDGVTLSNTYFFYLNGGRGVCIEPSYLAFDKLKENRVSDILFNQAISTKNGLVELYESGEHLGVGDVGLLSTIKTEELDRWENESFTKKTVTCKTFSWIIEMSPIKQFDFLSIDIEGMELEVLPQIDFYELGIKLACIEWNSKDKEKYDAIMMPFHFKLIHQNAENLIYTIDGNYTI